MSTHRDDQERYRKHLEEVAIPREKELLKKGDTSLGQFSAGGLSDVPLSRSEHLAQLESALAGINVTQ